LRGNGTLSGARTWERMDGVVPTRWVKELDAEVGRGKPFKLTVREVSRIRGSQMEKENPVSRFIVEGGCCITTICLGQGQAEKGQNTKKPNKSQNSSKNLGARRAWLN